MTTKLSSPTRPTVPQSFRMTVRSPRGRSTYSFGQGIARLAAERLVNEAPLAMPDEVVRRARHIESALEQVVVRGCHHEPLRNSAVAKQIGNAGEQTMHRLRVADSVEVYA